MSVLGPRGLVGAPRPVATRRRRGFTLIELLVVIAVIAVLAALTMPVLLRAVNIAEVTKCGGNLRQIGQAVSMYTANNDLFLPTTPRNSTVTVGGAPGHKTNYTMKDRPLNKYLGEGSAEVVAESSSCEEDVHRLAYRPLTPVVARQLDGPAGRPPRFRAD